MNKLTIITGIIAAIAISVLSSCNKDNNDCKVCSYTESGGSNVSLGELCGDEYKTVESNGFSGYPVTCQ